MKLKNYLKNLAVGVTGILICSHNLTGQTAEELKTNLANPQTNYQQFVEDMNYYLNSTSSADAELVKNYARQNSFYGPYIGVDGTINNFYPDFLPQTTAASQALPNINNCNLPSLGWKLLGAQYVISNDSGHPTEKGWNGRVTSVEVDAANNIVYAGTENGGLWKKEIGTDDWENITDKFGFPALGVYDIAINPSNSLDIYCATGIHKYQGTGGYGIGIIHTTDGGQTWVRENVTTNQGYNIEALSVAFTDFAPYTVFASLGNDLYRRDNTSPVWTSVYSTKPAVAPADYREIIREIKFIAPINGAQRKIVVSTLLVNGTGSAHIAIRDLDQNNDVTGTWSRVDNTTSGGLITHNTGVIDRIDIDITRGNPQKIYASYGVIYSTGDAEVIMSTDFGNSWSNVYYLNNAPFHKGIGRYYNSLGVSKVDDSKFYYGGFYLYKSIDDNTTANDWQAISTGKLHQDIRDIQVVVRNGIEELWAAHDGGIHRTINDGHSWVLEYKNMTIGEYYDIGVTELDDRLVMGSLDNGTHTYRQGVWERAVKGDGSSAMIFKSDPDFAIGNFNSNFTLYNFSTSTSFGFKDDGYPHLGLNAVVVQSPIYGNKAYLGGAQLYEIELVTPPSDLSNVSMSDIGNLSTLSSFPADPKFGKYSSVTGVAMSYQTENKIYVSLNTNWSNFDTDPNGNAPYSRTLYKTTNKGGNWIDISDNITVNGESVLDHGVSLTDVVLSPQDDEEIYVSVSGIIDGGFKVVKSANGGANWHDFTGSLPNIVVHELEVLDSYPNNVLIAATDLGIYIRRLDGTSDWECFNNQLPPCIIKNMEVRYCSQELYVATHGHGIYKADLSNIFDNQQETVVDLGNTLNWTSPQTYYKDVIVGENSKLNITGTTISMAAGAKIIVKSGGILTINNSTITNECGGFWSGIEIWSDANATTQLCNAPSCGVGKVVINNSTISNADNAISSDKPGTYVHGGGVIQATNTHFLNNRRAVAIAQFENHTLNGQVIDNISRFKNCVFEINADFRFDIKQPLDKMVSAWGVRGIKFLGCDFINSSEKAIETIGLYMYNANFTIANLGNNDHSTFKNLASGVTALKAGFDYNFVVKDAVFTDCQHGVVANGIRNASITQNTFTLTDGFLYHRPVSIFLENADGFIVEENTITNITTGLTVPDPNNPNPFLGDDRGIVAKNTGAGSNSIYKNTFDNVHLSNVAYGVNYNPSEIAKGLIYRCNETIDTQGKDFVIFGGNVSGIAGKQGANGDPVDNMFTSNMNQVDGHIANSATNAVNYYYRDDAGGYIFEPTQISSDVNPVDALTPYDPLKHCLTNLTEGGSSSGGLTGGRTNEWKTSFSAGKTAFDQAKYVYVSTIDGGDTYALLNTVQSTNTQTAWNMRTQLIESSPLSMEVIHQVVDEEFLSNALLHDVLMVNPHGVRDEEVMYKLENKTDPMPAYMINTLLDIYEVQTQKDVLEAEMANEAQKMATAAKFLFVHWSADSINPDNDSVLYITQEQNTVNADWKGVEYHVSTGNTDAAKTSMDAIPTNHELSEWEQTTYDSQKEYYTYFLELINEGPEQVYEPIDVASTDLPSMVGNAESYAGRMAQNQILWAEGTTYWPVIANEPQYKQAPKRVRKPTIVEAPQIVSIYPNPANSYVTIEGGHTSDDVKTVIKMVNTSGVEVLHHEEYLSQGAVVNLMTQDLAPGHYFVLIYHNDQEVQKLAFEIIH